MNTLPALIRDALRSTREDALVERIDGVWTPVSSGHLLERVEAVALALREHCKPGDRIALIAGNRVDWIVANFGILFARCVSVPIYPNQTIENIRHILRECGARVAFVDFAAAERLRASRVDVPIVMLDGRGAGTLAGLEARGTALGTALDDHLAQPSDLAVLAYTSGTTGTPKGVMLSHANLVRNTIDSFAYAFTDVQRGEPVLSVLPFSHVYEHMLSYGYLHTGTPLYVTPDAAQLLSDLRAVRPVVMATVPRILETMLTSIVTRARSENPLKMRLVQWALAVGREYMRAEHLSSGASFGLRAQYAAAQALVLEKIRPALGLDRLRFLPCGSARLHLDTLLTLHGAGIQVVEGYGLTECSPLVTVNLSGRIRPGTVGKPVPNVELKIAPDGEILVRGPNVMLGYYRDPAATASVLDADGWLRTGDLGELDHEGYLRITDREKDLLKTSAGEFVAPASVESAIKRSLFVRDVMVVGDGRPHLAALIAPNWASLRTELNVGPEVATESMAVRTDVLALVRREVSEQTADLAPYERIRQIAIVPHDLTIEGGELSPTLKIKRLAMEAKYRVLIDAAFGVAR
ncbi:MAG: AMP-dependent synthetase/ligase [Vulcanimicrobiaceae bacterium]